MKKLIIISAVLLFCTSQAYPQPGGSGTFTDPYYGTISTNTDWYPDSYSGGQIYVLSLTIASGATLSIRPGQYEGGIVKILSTYTLTIQPGCTVTIYPGTGLTVDEIYNSGTLILESSSNEIAAASLIHDVYDDNGGAGVVQIKHFIRGGQTPGGDYRWHYIASPVPNVSVSTYNTQNLAQYIESLVTSSDNSSGWVAYDGYQYSTGATLGNLFNTLTLGKGYNYYSINDAIITYNGLIHTILRNTPVTCGTGYPDYQGYNLIGNPYTACLDWEANWELATPAFVNDAIYFTLNGAVASYVGGIGTEGGTGYIPPLQGFFVKVNPGANSVPMRPGARVHNVEQLRYKKKSTAGTNPATDTIAFVRLKMTGSNDSTDLVVRFNAKATSDYDPRFDAYEFSRTSGDLNIWTTTAGTDYSINGLPFPGNQTEVPVGINLKLNGTFRLSSSEMNKLDNFSILLKDLHTNQVFDLRKGEFAEFSSSPGSITDRFVIVIYKSATSIPDLNDGDNQFVIYTSTGKIVNVRSISHNLGSIEGSITVYDLRGRKLYQQESVEWNSPDDIKQIPLDALASGLVLVEVRTGDHKYIEKLLLH